MEEGGFLPENILKRGLTFYEALYWARESGGTKFFLWGEGSRYGNFLFEKLDLLISLFFLLLYFFIIFHNLFPLSI